MATCVRGGYGPPPPGKHSQKINIPRLFFDFFLFVYNILNNLLENNEKNSAALCIFCSIITLFTGNGKSGKSQKSACWLSTVKVAYGAVSISRPWLYLFFYRSVDYSCIQKDLTLVFLSNS